VHAAFIGANQLIEKLVLAGQDTPDQHLFVELFGWTLQRNHHLRHRSSPHETRHHYARKITQLNLADGGTGDSPVQPGGHPALHRKLGSTPQPVRCDSRREVKFRPPASCEMTLKSPRKAGKSPTFVPFLPDS